MCRCVSTMPGMTMPPAASISKVPSGTSSTAPRRKTIGRPASGMGAFVLTGLLPGGSRDEDRLGAAGGLALALPGVGDVVERARVDVDGEVAGGGVLGEAQVGVALELHRRMGDVEAAQV